MKIEFPEHEQELESIGSFLERHTFPDFGKIKGFLGQLSKIESALEKTVHPTHYIEKQKDLVKKLAGRCHQLEIRRNVINLAEDAESLANSSPERPHNDVAKEAHDLRNRIDSFLKEHRPSRNNAKFIRFAKACIDKAEKHEKVISGKKKHGVSLDSYREKEATPETLQLAELLYEVAGLLYHEKFEDFSNTLSQNFSPEDQKEIHFHVSTCGGNFQNLIDLTTRLKSIQGILGYAHLLADYYMDNTPYPTLVEIHALFQDLDFVTHLEEEEK